MFGTILNLFQIHVEEDIKKGIITISNVDTDSLLRDIEKTWATSTVSKYIFIKITRNSLSFYSFFCPDIYMAIEKIADFKYRTSKPKERLKILEALRTNTWYADYFKPRVSTLDYSKLDILTYTLLPTQLNALKVYDDKVIASHLKGYLLAAVVGSGKAQPLDAKIKIPGGWKTMGEMQLGDIITAKDGTATKVIGVYPQGSKEIFRLTFADGRSTECCGEHLWKVYKCGWINSFRIVNTFELIRLMSASFMAKRLHYIELIDPEDSNEVNLPIDPYVLGVLLGDGYLGKGRVHITTPDKFIVDELIRLLPTGVSLQYKGELNYAIVGDWTGTLHKNSVLDVIRKLELSEKLSHEKFIPPIFLNGSNGQRLAILQGLMDTDGTACITGTSSFCSTSHQLAKDVQYLVRSLGGIAKIALRYPKYTYNGELLEGRVAYQVNIRFKTPKNLFRLPKKQDRVSNTNQYSKYLKLRITDIENIGKKEAQCIAIDHPDHLYVTNDFIVTHNSIMGLALTVCLDADPVIIICPKYIIDSVWVDAITTQFRGTKKIWKSNDKVLYDDSYDFYIFHYEALVQAVDLVSRYTFKKPVIILDESHNLNDMKSLRTQLYLDFCKKSGSVNIIHESGTPIKALGREATPLFRAIDPMFTAEVETRFNGIYNRSASRALDILANRLGMISHKIAKEEVMSLPSPIRKEVRIKLPDVDRFTLPYLSNELVGFCTERAQLYAKDKEYHSKIYLAAVDKYKRTMVHDDEFKAFSLYQSYIKTICSGFDATTMGFMSQYCNKFEKEKINPLLSSQDKKDFKNSKSVVKYVELKIMGEYLGGVLGRRRIELHSAMIEHSGIDKIVAEAEKKTICFTSYVDTVQVANDYFKKRGYKPLLVYSDTNNNVNGILNEFKNTPDTNPLIATIQSLSTGVTLICANTVIFLNQPFRAHEYEQASARVYRIGQDTQVYLWDLMLDTGDIPNLSTRMLDIQKWSGDQIAAILNKDFGDIPVGTDGNVPALEEFLDKVICTEDYMHKYIEDVIVEVTNNKPTALDW